ncbi:response regulator [Qingshengfaniella alkalisoli]|uniref:Response regulator n=1 Tax=Qingshengfaniella alkalisoli TaxID=2599296 RepID=A0A5B8IZR5_9RHOB|nr:response regulator [Qingshengfaniella alkalisoli]QDY71154.1 response regulator [Qingshengfaniella alkalisoli]
MTRTTGPALIFVIEDEDALRRDIVEELQESGYRTMEAANGDAALDLLVRATPDLFLCDISMPGLDGYGVLRSLRRQRPELAAIPFVFLTALSEPKAIVEGKMLGADDYLVKPVDYDLMLATVEARLRQVERIRKHHNDELTALQDALAGLSERGVEKALDLVAVGVVLLDGAGRVLHVNSAAHEMAASDDCIRIQSKGGSKHWIRYRAPHFETSSPRRSRRQGPAKKKWPASRCIVRWTPARYRRWPARCQHESQISHVRRPWHCSSLPRNVAVLRRKRC